MRIRKSTARRRYRATGEIVAQSKHLLARGVAREQMRGADSEPDVDPMMELLDLEGRRASVILSGNMS